MCYQYFLFKTEGSDEDSDCFQIINLDNSNTTIMVEDFVKDPECRY